MGNADFSGHVDAHTSAGINVRNGDHVGNNQLVAEAIHSLVGRELMEIKAEAPYPSDYDETVAQNQQEQRNGTMPAISTTISADNYGIIFVGYPVWATTLPAPVKTFLTQNDVSGKMIVPFCTHAGCGAGRSGAAIQELCPDAQVRSVLAADDNELEQAGSLVASRLEELNIPETSSGLSPEQTQMITLTIGKEVITAELNNTPAAQEFARSLPITAFMTRTGELAYYGALSEPLWENGNTHQTGYTVGDLAFWTPGDLFAFYFDEPETPLQGLIILGHIRFDLSVFDRTGNRESVRIELLPS